MEMKFKKRVVLIQKKYLKNLCKSYNMLWCLDIDLLWMLDVVKNVEI